MKAISTVFLVIMYFIGFAQQPQKQELKKTEKSQFAGLSLLKTDKIETDKLLHSAIKNHKTTKLIVLVKLNNSNKLRVVVNGKFPENVETTFNLLLDDAGDVIYALESPVSESGDWDIEYKSYFDKNGRLYAFEKFKGFFNEECSTGNAAIHETINLFFDDKGKRVDSTFKITDSKRRPVKYSNCGAAYNYPYKVLKTTKEYFSLNHINLSQTK